MTVALTLPQMRKSNNKQKIMTPAKLSVCTDIIRIYLLPTLAPADSRILTGGMIITNKEQIISSGFGG